MVHFAKLLGQFPLEQIIWLTFNTLMTEQKPEQLLIKSEATDLILLVKRNHINK